MRVQEPSCFYCIIFLGFFPQSDGAQAIVSRAGAEGSGCAVIRSEGKIEELLIGIRCKKSRVGAQGWQGPQQ